MMRDNTIDVVVTNGYRVIDNKETLRWKDFAKARLDPLATLLSENWLTSSSALFRSTSITVDYFDDDLKYREWLVLAFRLCLARRNIYFLDTLTNRIYENKESLSRTPSYFLAEPITLKYMLSFDVPVAIRRILKRKLSASLHNVSAYYLQNGEIWQAWKSHLKSLCYPGGLRYLLYTRKLVAIVFN